MAKTPQQFDRQTTIEEAFKTGLDHAAAHSLTKPTDVMICIEVALDNAGFHITRKPKAKE